MDDVTFRLGLLVSVVLLASALWPNKNASAGSSANARGAELFAGNGCAHCHGTAGVGGGKGPDLQSVRDRMDAAAIAKQVRNGGMAMPAFGSQFDEKQLKDLVEYLRAKRKLVVVPEKPPMTQKPDGHDPE